MSWAQAARPELILFNLNFYINNGELTEKPPKTFVHIFIIKWLRTAKASGTGCVGGRAMSDVWAELGSIFSGTCAATCEHFPIC